MSAYDVLFHTALNCCLACNVLEVCIRYVEGYDGSAREPVGKQDKKQHVIATVLEIDTAA